MLLALKVDPQQAGRVSRDHDPLCSLSRPYSNTLRTDSAAAMLGARLLAVLLLAKNRLPD